MHDYCTRERAKPTHVSGNAMRALTLHRPEVMTFWLMPLQICIYTYMFNSEATYFIYSLGKTN